MPHTPELTSAIRKASRRLLPLLGLGYGIAYIDRVNISYAALHMNEALHFSASTYGLGAGLFFLSYALCEVPSNLLLVRFGARRWLARIMLTWGLVSVLMLFVRTPAEFYTARIALGIAEAGFFPGVIFYLSQWFPPAERSRAVSRFYISLPLSTTVMGAIAGALLSMHGLLSLQGWQWLFLLEGLPAVLMSAVYLWLLPDSPSTAHWLTVPEKSALTTALASSEPAHSHARGSLLQAWRDPRVWLLGLFLLLQYLGLYAYTFSAPAIVEHVTGFGVTATGMLLGVIGILAALAMLGNGWHSDRTQERFLHVLLPTLAMAAGFLAIGLSQTPAIALPALVLIFGGFCATQPAIWPIVPTFLKGPALAAGIATINTLAICGGFLGPSWMGRMVDRTGTHQHALLLLSAPVAFGSVLLIAAQVITNAQHKHRAGPNLTTPLTTEN